MKLTLLIACTCVLLLGTSPADAADPPPAVGQAPPQEQPPKDEKAGDKPEEKTGGKPEDKTGDKPDDKKDKKAPNFLHVTDLFKNAFVNVYDKFTKIPTTTGGWF